MPPTSSQSQILERSRGLDGHNIITAIMQEYHPDLQQPLYWLSGYASKTISNFLGTLPSWDEKTDQSECILIESPGVFVVMLARKRCGGGLRAEIDIGKFAFGH